MGERKEFSSDEGSAGSVTRLLKHFMSERGKIMPRRMTGTCANHQRKLREEIKKARHLAFLPFTTVVR
jgi:ribosomal protein S18